MRAGLALTALLFGAAVVHHGAFDLQARPAGLLYFASYLVVGCGSAWILRALRTGQRDGERMLTPSC